MLQDRYNLIPEKVPGPRLKFLQWKNAFTISPSLRSENLSAVMLTLWRHPGLGGPASRRGYSRRVSQQQTLMNRSISHSNWTRVTNKPGTRSSTVVACMKKRLHHQNAMKQKTHQHGWNWEETTGATLSTKDVFHSLLFWVLFSKLSAPHR